MNRRHADNLSHTGHYLVDPYSWPWSPNGHGHGHSIAIRQFGAIYSGLKGQKYICKNSINRYFWFIFQQTKDAYSLKASPVYMREQRLAISVIAGDLAPSSARP